MTAPADRPVTSPAELRAATPEDRHAIAGRLAVSIGRINRLVRPGATSLSYGMLSALATIVRQGPLRPGDIAIIETVTRPTMTRVISELESRGLVHRADDPSDGRAFVVSATPAGQEAVVRARAERAEHVMALLADLGDDQVAAIGGALDALDVLAEVPTDAA